MVKHGYNVTRSHGDMTEAGIGVRRVRSESGVQSPGPGDMMAVSGGSTVVVGGPGSVRPRLVSQACCHYILGVERGDRADGGGQDRSDWWWW